MILHLIIRLSHLCEYVKLMETVKKSLHFAPFNIFVNGQDWSGITLYIMSWKLVFD